MNFKSDYAFDYLKKWSRRILKKSYQSYRRSLWTKLFHTFYYFQNRPPFFVKLSEVYIIISKKCPDNRYRF